tara:strand:- start:25 stop:546 length:522 start_codon:yes stop_codon:yes gene_type:complete
LALSLIRSTKRKPHHNRFGGFFMPGVPMQTSSAGLALIKEHEGLRLDAYLCPAKVWTIGYGHTGDVHPGQRITEAMADLLLQADLKSFERAVSASVKVPLTQGQFDALVSFTFNVGAGAFRLSTLLRVLNEGDYRAAAKQFDRWVHGGGKVLPGLVRRRRDERALFEEATHVE